MKALRRIITTAFLVIIACTAMAYFLWYHPKFKAGINSYTNTNANKINESESAKLKTLSVSLKNYTSLHYNSHICFIIDMSISSGKKRFFVYNLKTDSVELAGLVTHGSGCEKGRSKLLFSNLPNSNCTSLGKYKIGGSYYGKFGLAFKLYGLDNSNNNAYLRFVVLHSHACVPDDEVAPFPICKSLGCPTVSPSFLLKLKSYIENSRQPILLQIVE